ncbi:hypothetical protein BV25DRAFT_1454040 [Artomyces pyxidatus]|uniref:Uncharacterized protein n=1 Tax=Artomyces pyxidatus TaxID=48021 RepID=A0ACB8SL61_9AGAM|nr:hypothetical protein BV25DRAFT_1454040 [Artomyces pyxidatus]
MSKDRLPREQAAFVHNGWQWPQRSCALASRRVCIVFAVRAGLLDGISAGRSARGRPWFEAAESTATLFPAPEAITGTRCRYGAPRLSRTPCRWLHRSPSLWFRSTIEFAAKKPRFNMHIAILHVNTCQAELAQVQEARGKKPTKSWYYIQLVYSNV